jgi:hypothetical protein
MQVINQGIFHFLKDSGIIWPGDLTSVVATHYVRGLASDFNQKLIQEIVRIRDEDNMAKEAQIKAEKDELQARIMANTQTIQDLVESLVEREVAKGRGQVRGLIIRHEDQKHSFHYSF